MERNLDDKGKALPEFAALCDEFKHLSEKATPGSRKDDSHA